MAFVPITANTPPEDAAHIYAEDDAAIYQSIFGTDGVLDIGSKLSATIQSNNTIRIADGVIVCGGHIGRNRYADYTDVTVTNGSPGKNRVDLIVAEFTTSGFGGTDTYTIKNIRGTETSGTPLPPTIMQENIYAGGKTRQIPLYKITLSGAVIKSVEKLFNIITNIWDLMSGINGLVQKETVHAKLMANWFVISDKENYSLAAVYSLRDDAANYVQGIQRRSTGGYTVLVNGGTNGAEMDFLAVWIKNGGFSSGGTGEGGGTDIPVTVSGNYHLETKTVLLSYASPTLLRGYALFDSKIISAAATIEDRQNTPVLQTENVYTDVGYAGTETRVEIYAKGANYVSGHILAVHVLAVLEGAGTNPPGTGGGTETTLPTPDKTLTVDGGYADAAATGEAIRQISEQINNLPGNGLNAVARNLLITILRAGVYTTDQSGNIAALEQALTNESEQPSGIVQSGSILAVTSGVTASKSEDTLIIGGV
jgi:hypothetical protein